jgi:protein ImuA
MATSAAYLPPPRYRVALTLSGVLSTGLSALDRCLPGGGWPLGEISELVGQDEAPLQLLLPALAALSWEDRWITLITPPATVRPRLGQQCGLDLSRFRHAHAHPRVSPMENARRAVAARQSAAVVVWVDRVSPSALVRLRAALANTDTGVFLIRPETALSQAPISTLRLHVAREPTEGLRIRLLHVAWSYQVVLSLSATDGVPGDHRPVRSGPTAACTHRAG